MEERLKINRKTESKPISRVNIFKDFLLLQCFTSSSRYIYIIQDTSTPVTQLFDCSFRRFKVYNTIAMETESLKIIRNYFESVKNSFTA